MTKQYVLFDLDGTITDPAVGITNSVRYSLEKHGIQADGREELYKFIGPPLWESYEKFYGFTKEEANQAVAYFREYYSEKGIYENVVYDGIEELFQYLRQKGKTLIVATSKAEVFAKRVMEHFNLDQYFSFIAGSEFHGSRVKKDEVIEYALHSHNITDPSQVVMVGDREHDVIGAKKNGISSIGVLYGYGSLKELQDAGCDYIVESVKELMELFK